MTNLSRFTDRGKRSFSFATGVVEAVFKKYQTDRGSIIVSSISFNVLLAFIPFTLLSIFLLGYVVDLGNPEVHLEKFIRNVLPEPYDVLVLNRVLKELYFIEESRVLSGPLGLITLFFFTTRLFSTIQGAFAIIFKKGRDRFLKGKGKEILFTLIFSVMQALLFFSFVFILVVGSKMKGVLPAFFGEAPLIFLLSFLDMCLTFGMLFLLYYVLSPARKAMKILLFSVCTGTIAWHLGRSVFKHYILVLGKITTFFGTYGVFIGFLFWLYFSVFVFITAAELQAILLEMKANRGQEPSSSRSRYSLSKEPKAP